MTSLTSSISPSSLSDFSPSWNKSTRNIVMCSNSKKHPFSHFCAEGKATLNHNQANQQPLNTSNHSITIKNTPEKQHKSFLLKSMLQNHFCFILHITRIPRTTLLTSSATCMYKWLINCFHQTCNTQQDKNLTLRIKLRKYSWKLTVAIKDGLAVLFHCTWLYRWLKKCYSYPFFFQYTVNMHAILHTPTECKQIKLFCNICNFLPLFTEGFGFFRGGGDQIAFYSRTLQLKDHLSFYQQPTNEITAHTHTYHSYPSFVKKTIV